MKTLQKTLIAASLASIGFTAYAQNLPVGGTVSRGAATISTAGTTMTVTQTGGNILATNWQSFNIGAGNTVNFVQPSAQAIALNRVTGTTASTINGNLNANGQVFLVNPNGILFGQTAQVNVGGLVATTHSITDSDIVTSGTIASRLNQNVTSSGDYRSVQNFGVINTTGSAVLTAFGVQNHGTINASANVSLVRSDRASVILDAIGLHARSTSDVVPLNDGFQSTERSILLNKGVINAGNKVTIHTSGTFFNFGKIQSEEEINLNTRYQLSNLGSLDTSNLIIERSNWFINGDGFFNNTNGVVNAQNFTGSIYRFWNKGTLNIGGNADFYNLPGYSSGQIYNDGIINVGNNLNIGMNARSFDDFYNTGTINVSNSFNTENRLLQRSRFLNSMDNAPISISSIVKAKNISINYGYVENGTRQGGFIGDRIDIKATDYITNKGYIDGASKVDMSAKNISNVGGSYSFIKGNDVFLNASNDIVNNGTIGQTGRAIASSVVLNADHWIVNFGTIGSNTYRTRIRIGSQLFNYGTIGSTIGSGNTLITGGLILNRGSILSGVTEMDGGRGKGSTSFGALGGKGVDM